MHCVRAFTNGLFLLIGWSLVALSAKKKILWINTGAGRKRKRRTLRKEIYGMINPNQLGTMFEERFLLVLSHLYNKHTF